MQSNIPRAAIHVGKDKKSFSAKVGNEAERRGWDENVYRLKNADKNNHTISLARISTLRLLKEER